MEKQCLNCGKLFKVKRKWQVWCSPSCRVQGFYLNKALELVKNQQKDSKNES